MSFHKKETARQAYIRLLSKYASTSRFDLLHDEERDIVLSSELVYGQYLGGFEASDITDAAFGIRATGPTILPQGRLLLEQLKREESESSFCGRLLKWSVPAFTFFMGIVSGVLIEYAKKRLGL